MYYSDIMIDLQSVLIIRSVSFQHLDWVLTEVKGTWPNSTITLLTHAHGQDSARQTVGIDEVVVYPGKGDFSFWQIGKKVFSGCRFDQVLVPFSNCSGVGFDNVAAMAFRIPARRRWVLPLGAKPHPLLYRWWFRFPAILGMKILAFTGLVLIMPLVLLWLTRHLIGSVISSRRA